MNLNNNTNKFNITSDSLKFEVLESGDIFSISYNNELINMYRATSLDGMIANIFLRIRKNKNVSYTKLLGIDSPSKFKISQNQIIYYGSFNGVNYQVRFKISGTTWFWTITLDTLEEDVIVEVYYGQDISLSGPGANEAYVCQYLDHNPEKHSNTYSILTKQNQGHPLMIQQGSLNEVISYATDGFDFFGKSYKKDNKIQAFQIPYLPSRNYQYEFAYISFQTDKINLEKPVEVIFYAHFTPNFYETNLKRLSLDEIRALYESIKDDEDNKFKEIPKVELAINYQNTLPYNSLLDAEINELFPIREYEEVSNGKLLSWFSPDSTHLMIGDKEDYIERPQGNIIINQGMREIDNVFMCSTNYIFGIFNSQIALGNTQFNKLSSLNRTALNIKKTSGQRIFVRINNEYFLLAIPALYEVCANASSWYYKIGNDILKVEVAIDPIDSYILLNLRSLKKIKYDFLLTDELVMGEGEYLHPLNIEIEDGFINYLFDESTLAYQKYPQYSFKSNLDSDGTWEILNDEIFYQDRISRNNPILCHKIEQASEFSYSLYGITDKDCKLNNKNISQLKEEYKEIHKVNFGNFQIDINEDNENHHEIKKLNHIAYWYTHNALIHYASPHGLEQYGGGAWGTRDVCQGPVELFTAVTKFDLVKNTLIKVYERQFYETGDWPQWFMFDNFSFIQADSSHADIIVWPLYAISNYIINTGDKEILNVKVPYTSIKTGQRVYESTIYEHILKQIETIESNFLEGTYLSGYGGGDWDDTLQPFKTEARTSMVSSWTVALTIQSLGLFLSIQDDQKLRKIYENMKIDYHKYLMLDNVPAGFIDLKDEIKYIVHPKDELTGIKYRLISFNQGILSELFSKKQIAEYLDIIDKHLMHCDGVRLMDTTVKYQGGIPKIFMRAETATNFGREIGLHYIHAHIRYLEAMAKLGEADRFFAGLKVINPILINDNVKNAKLRQSNLYFSSSDGDFINRYEADKNFNKLRTGEIDVKAGWRLYSSGPGILLNQIITNFLGIKSFNNNLYIDPVLPISLDGLKVKFTFGDKELNITYEVTKNSGVSYVNVNGHCFSEIVSTSRYRDHGILIPTESLKQKNEIIVRL